MNKQKLRHRKQNKSIVRFNSKTDFGLTEEIVQERKADGLNNFCKATGSKSYAKIFLSNIFTFFNLVWLIIIIALIAVGAYENLLFCVVVVLNTAVAIWQECKSKKVVDKLKLVQNPQVDVLREGNWQKVAANELVLDDIIRVSNGDQIPCDLIVLEGKCGANEALLTGESDSIEKHVGDELLGGSFLSSGSVIARVNKVGASCFIEQISREAKKVKERNSDLFRDLSRLIKAISIILIPLGILQFVFNYFWQSISLKDTITNTCASLIGMIPSGMYLLVSIALAVGVIKLAGKRTLVQDIYSIEMLARTDTLCLDKTGTITTGEMVVKEISTYSDLPIEKILHTICKAQPTKNYTSKAILGHCATGVKQKVVKMIPFSSEKKESITCLKEFGTFALGAFEFLDAKASSKIKAQIAKYSSLGLRVLTLARSTSMPDKNGDVKGLQVVAVIAIEDKIRPDAKETIKWFKDNGVKIKVISGDNPVSVSNIAKMVGIENAEMCINLSGMSLEEVEKIACDYTVFGRVSPQQKRVLIQAMRKAGHTVAMTGDGVNDTLALKEADCSIAMAEGSEAARAVSSVVLLDNQFSALPSVVEEGRQAINNVQSSSSLFLMKTIFTMILSFVCLCSLTLYPFEPVQVFLLEIFVIGIPSFFLSLQPNKNLIKGSFLKNTLLKSFPYALVLFFNMISVIMLNKLGILAPQEFYSLSTLLFTSVGFVCLVKMCMPLSRLRLFCCGLSFILILIACLFIIYRAPSMLPSYAILESLTKSVWICLGLLLSLTILAMIVWRKVETRKETNGTSKETLSLN